MDIREVADKYNDYIIEKRRYFHAHPEVSEHEVETGKRIREELTAMGVEWRTCGTGNGVLETIHGAKPGKTILLRGDMDALAVQEETGAAKILMETKDEIPGKVKFIFQPSEENCHGANVLVAQGVMDDVDTVMGMHIWGTLDAPYMNFQGVPAWPVRICSLLQ